MHQVVRDKFREPRKFSKTVNSLESVESSVINGYENWMSFTYVIYQMFTASFKFRCVVFYYSRMPPPLKPLMS